MKKKSGEYRPIRQTSVAYRILQIIRARKVCSFYDIAYSKSHHIDRKTVASTLSWLSRQQYLSRSNFGTVKGRVYTIRGQERLILPYMIQNHLVPRTTPLFLKLLKEKRAFSTLELKSKGFDTPDINFFVQKFSHESRLCKTTKIENYNVIFLQERDFEKWKKRNLNKVKKLEVNMWKDRQEKGKSLEDNIEKFYRSFGFITERNKWFVCPRSGERLEVDILCRLPMLPESFDYRKELIIAVQCKNWQTGFRKEHFLTGNIVLSWSGKVREVFPTAICDFWAFHVSNILFKKSVLLNNPFIRIFSTKEINYAFESVSVENKKPIIGPPLKVDDAAHS